MSALVHTVAHFWPATDSTDEGFLCVCGEFFVNKGEETKWEPPITQLSNHLKEMNVTSRQAFSISREDVEMVAQPDTRSVIHEEMLRGLKGDKPENPEGDDPRAGHEVPGNNPGLPKSYFVLTGILCLLFVFMMLYPAFK